MTTRDWSKFPIGKPIIYKMICGYWNVKRNGCSRRLEELALIWAAKQNRKLQHEEKLS